ADFGYQQQDASIGDFVWNDLNGNGIQDGGGEVGIDGVTVDLIVDANGNGVKDGGETAFTTDTTSGGGAYDFTSLAANDYLVEVTDTGAVLTGFALTGGTNPDAVTITAGQDYDGADFGYQQQDASIGDFVWNDLNGDGVQDGGGEVGIDGVTVDLIIDANGNGVKDGGETAFTTDTTSGSGAYDFTGLAGGDYLVEVTDTGAVLTGFNLTGGTNPDAVTITAGQDYNDADFGYQDSATASIGDFIWNDLNGDGVQDGGEPVINGVTVDLIDDLNGNGIKDGGEPVLATDTTSGSGTYDFTGLIGDDYLVEVTDTGNVLTGLVLTAGPNPFGVTIGAGQDYNDADFGYKDPLTATLGNLVWNDRNGDGVYDSGEPGLDGITLNLTGFGVDDTYGTGDDVAYSPRVTSSGGDYEFVGLSAGQYAVDIDDASLPAGLTLATGTDPFTVTLAIGQTYADADFGYQGNASIAGFLWHDADSDGNQDIGESGLASITVYLDLDGDTIRDANEPFAVTDGSGNYVIAGLYASTYTIKVDGSTVPSNYFLDTSMASSITLTAGESFTGADFGFVESFEVYLPTVLNNYVAAPDLVVASVHASNDLVEVVIKNEGDAATTSGFWVDFYVAPSPVPSQANQLWHDVSAEGVVWGIGVGLAPGEVLTLTYSTDPAAPNLYYMEANSLFSGTMAPGTTVYAQVDSAHLATSYGGVLENHEISGGAYNNISAPAVSTMVVTAVSQTAVYISNEFNLLLPPR
ncbi:MAG: hypothetical protein GY943_24525, partial [Chloroflexi bacterium]|nr:hypothetical protein [Chloroflexota bacterium]